MNEMAEATRNSMINASDCLKNLDRNSENFTQVSEVAIYQIWKTIASFEEILYEDIRRQTNTIIMTTKAKTTSHKESLPSEQTEAYKLTGLFIERFEKSTSSPPHEQSVPDSTNQSITTKQDVDPETYTKIVALAMQAEASQKASIKILKAGVINDSLEKQQLSYRLLKEIEELLPKSTPQKDSKALKQKQQQEDSQKQETDPQQQDSDQSSQNKENSSQTQQENSLSNQDQPTQAKPLQEENQDLDKTQSSSQEMQDELSEYDLKRLLERALQREKEHEAKKRNRNHQIPLTPSNRDW